MTSSRRSRLLAIVTCATIVAAPTAAQAQDMPPPECTGDADLTGGGGTADGMCVEVGPAPSGGDGGEGCDEVSAEIAFYGEPPADLEETYLGLALQMTIPEGMAILAAYNCAGLYLGGPYLVPDPQAPDPGVVRDRARARLVPPLPTPSVSPGRAVVRVPTWLWVDGGWSVLAETETQGSVTVRVQARPVTTTWELDEATHTCTGPGVAWSPQAQQAYDRQPATVRGAGNPACTFTFVDSSTTRPDGVHHARVSVAWEFAWWLNGQPQGVFGSLERSTDFDVTVGEIQTVVTR